MRVALDGTPLTVPTGGVARYTAELSRALAEAFSEDDFWLVSDQPFPMPEPSSANLKRGTGPRNFRESKWWLWGLQSEMSRLQIDVFHGTDFSVPYLPLRPSVLTLHDLSPWLDPGWHWNADRVRSRTPVLLRLGLASIIVTPSQAVRREAMERFRLSGDRVVAVPLAASPHFRPIEDPPHRPRYFLYTGILEPRKNLAVAVEAWRQVRKKEDVDLILAGRPREDFQLPAPEPGLYLPGEVPEPELPGLYSGAVACLYPSLYEGFGLPVLEAMQCEALVIASKDPAITEVAGGTAVQVDANDTPGWVKAMRAALHEPQSFADLRRRARQRATDFSWSRTARLTREVYDEARRRFNR